MSSLLALLQLAVSLLLSVQNNAALSENIKTQAVATASQAVGLVSQTLAAQQKETPSVNLWPTADWLWSSFYLNLDGKRVPNGSGVTVMNDSISFGDMNHDNLDDAIVVTKNIAATNPQDVRYRLAVMLNQRGSFLNITNYDIGTTEPIIYSHEIEANVFTLDAQIGNQPRKTYQYKLSGNTLVQI